MTSIHLPDDVPASLPITFHSTAKQTNYISPIPPERVLLSHLSVGVLDLAL